MNIVLNRFQELSKINRFYITLEIDSSGPYVYLMH